MELMYFASAHLLDALRGFVLIGLMCRLKTVHESCALFRIIFGRD